MKCFKYQTGEAFLEAKARRKGRFWWWPLLSIGVCLGSCLSLFVKPTPKPRTILIEGARSNIDFNAQGDTKLWGAWIDSARIAWGKWKTAVPEIVRDVPDFSLIANPVGCYPDAIAQVDRVSGTAILVCKPGDDVDRVTIMMHEIGHILGLTHIEGDPLMDKNYAGNILQEPSPVAVVLVKRLHPGPVGKPIVIWRN